jgi:asparagine synthase (glutamine-hydrolysing)
VAKSSKSRHFWFEFRDGCWVVESLDLHLKLTEGFHSWIHMHGITMLEKLRAVMDFNLTGWDGGTVMGHSDHINEVYNFPVDEWTVAIHTYHRFNQDYTWPGLTEPEERLLYTPEYAGQAIGRAFESLRHEFSQFWRFRKEYAAEYFYVVNHCWRSTQQMVTMIRSHLEVRFPFWDYALVDFMYSLKPHLRRDQLLYRHIITRQTPRLAKIPYDKKEYLPTVNPWLYESHALAVRGLRRLGLYPHRHTLYADYENYLRKELREWAEGILFDKRTAERGIWDIDFVHSLMNRHLANHEEWTIGKIAPLITFELMMREYFD